MGSVCSQRVQAAAAAAGEIDRDVSVDSTIVRAQQHAAGTRIDPPPTPASKGGESAEHQDEPSWQSLHARLVEVVREDHRPDKSVLGPAVFVATSGRTRASAQQSD